MCCEVGVDFVKTSTGYSTMGATEHHVALMRQTVGDKMGVKASGGVRDRQTALKMIKAGGNTYWCKCQCCDCVTDSDAPESNY